MEDQLDLAESKQTEAHFFDVSKRLLKPVNVMSTLYCRDLTFNSINEAIEYVENDKGLQAFNLTPEEIRFGIKLFEEYSTLCKENPYHGEFDERSQPSDETMAKNAYSILQEYIKNPSDIYHNYLKGKTPFEWILEQFEGGVSRKQILVEDHSLEDTEQLEPDSEGLQLEDPDIERVQRALDDHTEKTAEADLHYAKILNQVFDKYFHRPN